MSSSSMTTHRTAPAPSPTPWPPADAGVHVLHRAGKLGLGTAYQAGFRYGVAHGYPFLCTMDADFSHSPESLPDLLRDKPGPATIW